MGKNLESLEYQLSMFLDISTCGKVTQLETIKYYKCGKLNVSK